jgi:flagellar biosynthetic protein FliR
MFGDNSNPLLARIMMSVAISAGMLPMVNASWAPDITIGIAPIFVIIMKEIIVGFTIGFAAKLLFDGVIAAAALVGFQMGFGTGTLFLQDADTPMDAFTIFHRSIVLLIFLSLGFHHIFIQSISETFTLIPAGKAIPSQELGVFFISLTAGVLSIALKLATPMVVALLFSMAALGLIARTVPQMNVFIMSFPISFFVGLLIYLATLPFLEGFLARQFTSGGEAIFASIRALAPVSR